MSTNVNSLVLKSSSLTKSAGTGLNPLRVKTLGDMTSELARLVFLFDISGSMNVNMSDAELNKFLWTPELMLQIRGRIESIITNQNNGVSDPELTESCLQWEFNRAFTTYEQGPNGEIRKFINVDDKTLQKRIILNGMTSFLKVPINPEKHGEKALTRMEVVKKLARREIEARFKKYPKSLVTVAQFDTRCTTLFHDGAPEQLWPALEAMHPQGGTDILEAIRHGIEVCRRSPSQIGVHHFIVVSDGGASVYELESWIPALKASGIVLDYIHIGDKEEHNTILEECCKKTGGEFVAVETEEELDQKFVAAVNRLMLPPAPEK